MKKLIIATTVALLTLSTANAEGMKCGAGKCGASMSSGKSTAALQKMYNKDGYDVGVSSKKGLIVGNNTIKIAIFKEGKKVAHAVDKSLKNNNEIQTINLTVSKNIKWYQPSIIDIDLPSDILTTLRVKSKASGILKVIVNDKEIWRSEVTLYPFVSFDIDLSNITFKISDKVHIDFLEH